MKKKFNYPIVISVFFISISFLLYYFIYLKKDPLDQEAKSYEGKLFPRVSLKNISGSNHFYEENIKDDALLVFMISTCDACKKEFQLISQLLADSSLNLESKPKIYAIMSEKDEVVKNYIEENNIKIPVLIDENAELLRELNIKYFPSNIRVKDGVIKKVYFGSPKNKEVLKNLLDRYWW